MRPNTITILFAITVLSAVQSAGYGQMTNTGNMQVFSGGSMLVRNEMTLSSGSDYTNNGAVYLRGDYINNSTIADQGTGTTYFNGSTPTKITGSEPSTFKNVVVNNSQNVLMEKGVSVTGTMNLASGNLFLQGNVLTLGSTVSGAGMLGTTSTSTLIVNGIVDTLKFVTNSNNLKLLQLNSGSNAVLGNGLNMIAGSTPGSVIANGTLRSNGFLTLKSDSLGTAAVATSSGTITGNVIVERFLGLNTQNGARTGRTWRLLTSPASGQTINEAWQEGMVSNNSVNYLTGSLQQVTHPAGYGTRITGYQQMNFANASGRGYDFWDAIWGANSSIRRYQPGTSTANWVNLDVQDNGNIDTTINPKTKLINSEQGYLLYVRGDRNYFNTTTFGQSTTLRSAGTLRFSNQSINVKGTSIAAYTVIGNPYAATINFEKIYTRNNSVILPRFWIYDANLGSYGAYSLVMRNFANNYTIIPDPFNGSGNSIVQYIQSGQAIFVEPVTSTGGNIIITENDKVVAGNYPVFFNNDHEQQNLTGRETKMVAEPRLMVNLNLVNANDSILLADGIMVRFHKLFSPGIDAYDVVKPTNFYENLAIKSDSTMLMVEARPLPRLEDTLYLKMWNVSVRKYMLRVKAQHVKGTEMSAWLEDDHLKSSTPLALDGSVTDYYFTVTNEPTTWAPERFKIIYKAKPAGTPAAGKSTERALPQQVISANIYPNPVSTAFTLQMEAPAGNYVISMINQGGQQVFTKNWNVRDKGAVMQIERGKGWANGVYNLLIQGDNGIVINKEILIVAQ